MPQVVGIRKKENAELLKENEAEAVCATIPSNLTVQTGIKFLLDKITHSETEVNLS